ncbi:MAG: nucleotide pyrophosphohydrolase [Oscillospiraceae bacterium]|nr:nucleotide pyrophosphohydrolase [Oscillospiraceae bacterium]
MEQFSLNEALNMQRTLQEKYKHKWEPICPESGKHKLLWMVGEIGEVADIVKKHGDAAAAADPALRAALTEELADVLMYFGDVLLCYGISAEQLGEAYRKKFESNMQRW